MNTHKIVGVAQHLRWRTSSYSDAKGGQCRRGLSLFGSRTCAHSKDNAAPLLANWLEVYSASQVVASDPVGFANFVPGLSPFLSASIEACRRR